MKALGCLGGVFSIVNDVVTAGCGQTVEEAEIDNQRKLTETLKRCAEKTIEITFLGHKITKGSVKVDKAKVEAICDMPDYFID